MEVPELISGFSADVSETVITLAFCNNQLAVGTVGSRISLLDGVTGSILHTLSGHAGGTNKLAFAAEARLVSIGDDGKAKVWDTAKETALETLEVEGMDADKTTDGHSVSHLAVSADGQHFACSSGRSVHLIDVLSENVEASRKVYPPVAASVADVKLTSDGFVLASYYGGISCWPMDVGIPGFELPHKAALLAADVAKLPDGSMWFVAGCHDSTVHIWKVSPGNMPGRLQIVELSCGGYEQKVDRCDFDPSGQYLASTGGTRDTVWDFSRDGPAGSIPTCTAGHTKLITCQAWQPIPCGLLATGSEDGKVLVYDVSQFVEGTPNMCVPAVMAETKGDPVNQLLWGAEDTLYSGHTSGMVRQWKLPDLSTSKVDPILASYRFLESQSLPIPEGQAV